MKVVAIYRTKYERRQDIPRQGLSFPPALDKDGTPTRKSAYEEDIRQSLWTLLNTSPGERVHRYDYGCPVRRYVFEIMDISTQTILRINLDYTIRRTNRRTNMVYPFYLHEGIDLVGVIG